jgi:hypothetical protein
MHIQNDTRLVETARLLTARLERLSADSYWAHRASGLRGSLLEWLERYEKHLPSENDLVHLDMLVKWGDDILKKAAREIRVPEGH